MKGDLATQAPGPVFVLLNVCTCMLVSCFLSVANRQHGVQELALRSIISYVLGT